MSKFPGENGKPFIIHFTNEWYKKGEIITTDSGVKIQIIGAYKQNWFRKILFWLGFKVKMIRGTICKIIP